MIISAIYTTKLLLLQAFGVGALEEADDDIYSTDHMSNYDMTMEIEDTSNLHGWTAPKHKHGGCPVVGILISHKTETYDVIISSENIIVKCSSSLSIPQQILDDGIRIQ